MVSSKQIYNGSRGLTCVFLLDKRSSRRRSYIENKVQDVVCEWCPAKVLSLKKVNLERRFVFRFS